MLSHVTVLATLMQTTRRTTSTADTGAIMAIFLVALAISLVIYVFYSWCLSKVFAKAGLTTWWAWVPFAQQYGLWKLTGRDTLWLILLFVPYANYVAIFVVMIDVAKSFGKSTGFGVGLALLSPFFLPALAFGDARYLGPVQAPSQPYGYPPAAGPYGYPPAAGPYGQPPYGQPPYGQPPYGQGPYDQAPPGQAPYPTEQPASPWGTPPTGPQ